MLLHVSSPAAAEPSLVIAELFTSQGCSSCPPADALVARLAQENDDFLPLSFHVDYWDYLGWRDKFGSPAHTERQRAYNDALGRRSIYTPQLVLNGRHQAVGSRSKQVFDTLDQVRAGPDFTMTASVDHQGFVHVDGPQATAKHVLAVWYTPEEVVEIRRGENRGRELTYTNVVKGMRVLKRKNGAYPLPLADIERADTDHLVVLVQDGAHGPIIGATRARLTELGLGDRRTGQTAAAE